jgi:isoleucyl-tRNA synthetase
MTQPSNPTSPQAAIFAKVPSNVAFPALEERILALWEGLDAFQESNRRRSGAPEFVFYDGPPFATGTPHYGHLLTSTIKDIIPRYWSMRGFHVDRRFGWDCHGLPIENLAQQALGLKGPRDIRERGVAVFNEQCRSMVQTYVAEWRRTITRLGRWVDFDDDYKTMDPSFMESVWWVFKRLWDLGRIYKAHRIMPYDPVLATPLSNFEAGNNYKDVQDPAVTLRFRLRDGGRFGGVCSLLAWTTTPWTLPGNLALCVGPDISYVAIRVLASQERVVLAAERLATYFPEPQAYEVLATLPGQDLVGLTYEPLLPFYADTPGAFRVVADAYVTTGDGTGIVHQAPAYGADDYRVCRREGIPLVDPLDEECRFTARIPEYAGQFCKDADKAIIRRLKEEGKLFLQSTLMHSYPFGERSEAPLIQRTVDAWFVKVADMRERLSSLNAMIRWVPEAIGANRFGNWIKDAPDWNISRNRYWGSCLPVWINVADATDMICVGSLAELEALSGVRVTDLHKHHVDLVEINRDGKRYRRTPEVLDCWFESGAMPYAQSHYPFERKERFEQDFPAQFIAEGLDQTRGWFYTLLVLSASLFDKPAYRNVVVNGLVLAEDGEKMSKSKKNYPDPQKILGEIGADALRAYLINSPVVRAEPMRFSEAGLKEIVRTVVLPYWNALSFFTTYATVDGFDPRSWTVPPADERAEMDRWILSTMQSLIRDVNIEMENYRLYNVVPRLISFIDDLTNWYIRRCRPRFWKNHQRADQAAAYGTLYEVLTTFAKVLAPCMPFLTEEVHQRLVRAVDPSAPASVHWCDYPQSQPALIDRDLEARIRLARSVVALGRKLREEGKGRLKVRQPLASLTVVSRDAALREAVTATTGIICDELNVKRVIFSQDEASVCAISVKPNFKELGKRAGPKLKEIGTTLTRWGQAEISVLEGGGTVEVSGVALGLSDVLLQRTPLQGSAVASEGALTVMLDTVITQELMLEGLARECISLLQQARKAAELEVADRIVVRWESADAEIERSFLQHAGLISEEVLAVRFERVASLGSEGTASDLNGRPLRWTLSRHE